MYPGGVTRVLVSSGNLVFCCVCCVCCVCCFCFVVFRSSARHASAILLLRSNGRDVVGVLGVPVTQEDLHATLLGKWVVGVGAHSSRVGEVVTRPVSGKARRRTRIAIRYTHSNTVGFHHTQRAQRTSWKCQ